MSLFGKIMDKIFHRKEQPKAAPSPQAAPKPPPTQASQAAPAPAPTPQPVDVEAVLSAMATQDSAGGGNWRTSIVDLLKLLDLDSSLTARKELAEELNVHVGEHGSAEQNIALHKAVMRKLAENGGKVPDSLKD